MARKTPQRKTKTKAAQKSSHESNGTCSWFMLMGYNKENEDETGLLAFDTESTKHTYKIVHDT